MAEDTFSDNDWDDLLGRDESIFALGDRWLIAAGTGQDESPLALGSLQLS